MIRIFSGSNHLQSRAYRIGILASHPGDKPVGVAHVHHHGAKVIPAAHIPLRLVQVHTLALTQPVILIHVFVYLGIIKLIHNFDLAEINV
ncbi:MAG: hypothetical protein MAGBODY4_00239 [Candidatus Marinimicrobia bacterium]|nr:hypothetical protein [Candidatus Neomarinimicrobiota bacterium]